MSKPVNLNRFRKAKARAEKSARADENAVVFGLTKAEKLRAREAEEKAVKSHEAHQRETEN